MSQAWRHALRGPATAVSLAIVLLAIAIALAAPMLGLPPPDALSGQPYARPSAQHWLGTDNFGRDVLARVVWGARLALMVAVVSAGLSTIIGVLMGSVSGYFGGWVDALMSRTFDVFLLIPAFFLVLLIVALFGSDIRFVMLAIAVTTWPRSARIMRSQVLSLKSRTFVQAALSAGASHWRVLFRHVIPNGLPPIITDATLLMGLAVLTEAGLSFLGLGDQNTVSWGRMIFEGQRQLRVAPWIAIYPGVAMLILVAAFNLLGDGFNQVLNPSLRVRRGAGRARPSAAPAVPAPQAQTVAAPLIDVQDLRMYYRLGDAWVRAVDGVSFALPRGGSLGIVGESGCGKSSLGTALMQVLPPNARLVGGRVLFDGKPVLDVAAGIGDAAFREVRWTRQSMIFQSAMNALNPVMTVRRQLAEAYRLHRPGTNKAEVTARIEELFDLVGLPRWRADSYPHELSGGMRQRAMIALGLLLNPDLVIADEPTTALDVIIQDQIMAELEDLRARMNLTLILISHDMGTIAESCERVAVMYAGQIVEQAATEEIFVRPRHPYTHALISALPSLSGPKRALAALPGEPFVPVGEPVACRFAPRCPFATELCRAEAPPVLSVAHGHLAACHYAGEDIAARPVREAVS